MKEGLEKDAKKVDSSGVKDVEISTDTGKKKIKEERPPTKVVVRRLPPTMTEEEFLQQIDPVPPVDYMYYVPADMSLSPNSFCRAYLNFINQSDIFIFTQKFDGYVFVDSKGLEYPAVVEFSPFQRIPKQRPGRKKDPKAGTLESDVTYKSFLEKLQAQIQESTTAGSNIKQHFFETNVTVNENKVSTTPLLDYLRSRHAERLRAREEKRKKDLERKRARDEQRRNAKKPEEDSSVVKVLPSQTHSNKDKLKDKDSTKPVKKRIEDRIKETKGRVGKSYSEERQKQIEKREEQRKKYSNISSKSSKSQTDKKSSEQNSVDLEKNSSSESKKIENDTKSVDNENKKDSYGEKKNYQHKYFDSQKHYDYGKRDDEVKRRSRDDRTNKTKDSYRDRREDRFSTRKKSDKKSYDRHEDYNKDKYRKEHSYKKESSHNNGADKKSDSEVKKDKTLESTPSEPVEKEKCNVDTDSVAADRQINLKVDENNRDGSLSIVAPEPKSEVLKGNEVNKNELKNGTKTKTYESMKQRRNSLESAGDGLSFFQQERTELIDEIQQTVKVRRSSLESVYDLSCEGFIKKHSDNNADNSDCGSEKQFSRQIGTAVYVHKQSESDNGSIKTETDGEHDDVCRAGDMGIQKSDEVVLKRRNSLEMYDKKDESSEKIREMTRRSSLESGDKNTNCKQLEKKHEGKKRSDEPTKSKLKDPRTERRIRNKDRPSIEIYRPGMGRFSKQRMEREKVLGSSTEVDSNSPSPSPTLVSKNKSTLVIVNQNRDS